MEIVAIALDASLRPHANLDEEVARRAAELSGMPLAANRVTKPAIGVWTCTMS